MKRGRVENIGIQCICNELRQLTSVTIVVITTEDTSTHTHTGWTEKNKDQPSHC